MTYYSLLRQLCLLPLLLLAHTTWAQSIYMNPITLANPSASNPYTAGQTVDPNITVSGIGRGAGILPVATAGVYNADGWNENSLAAAIADNDYFSFTITPNAGYNIDFVSFVYTSQVANNGPTNFAFRSSVDNFATNIGTPTGTGATISLSAAAYQNIITPITFRLYAWGAQTPNNAFGINDFVFNGAVPLPIELTAFRAEAIDGRSAKLSFSTATERNNNFFVVERSQDGTRFGPIGQVQGAGNSSVPQHYTYSDEHPAKGLNFYRLKQVDFDGQFSYSPVVSLTFGQTGGLHLAPQPVFDQVHVTLEHPVDQNSQWQIYDFAGRLLQSGTVESESTDFMVPTASLTEGSYVLRLLSGATVLTHQFQKR